MIDLRAPHQTRLGPRRFQDMKGFSPRNVKYMRYFAEHCPARLFGQQPADQSPWFYILSAMDAQVKAEDDKPTIGLLLCRSKNSNVTQYAVNGIDKPIGIAEFDLLCQLPVPLAENLPSIEEIEFELSSDLPDKTKGTK